MVKVSGVVEHQLEEVKDIKICVTDSEGNDITGITSSVTIYDSNNQVVVGPDASTTQSAGSAVNVMYISKRITYSGTGTSNIVKPGMYTAVFKVTYGSYVTNFEVKLLVHRKPSK